MRTWKETTKNIPLFTCVYKLLVKHIKEEAGELCDSFTPGCIVCQANLAVGIIKDLMWRENLVDARKWPSPNAIKVSPETPFLAQYVPFLEGFLLRNVGKRCETFNIDCECCQYWMAHDILAGMLMTDIYVSQFKVKNPQLLVKYAERYQTRLPLCVRRKSK